MSRRQVWLKFIAYSTVLCIGGPALVYYVTPTEEDILRKLDPEAKKRVLANRDRRDQDFDDFVSKLKEYSKSPKQIWMAAAEAEQEEKKAAQRDIGGVMEAMERRRKELKEGRKG